MKKPYKIVSGASTPNRRELADWLAKDGPLLIPQGQHDFRGKWHLYMNSRECRDTASHSVPHNIRSIPTLARIIHEGS